MTLATSLRTAARTLIETFGNDATLFTYSTAAKTESDEGDITITDWGAGTAIKVVDDLNIKEEITNELQGRESTGADEKLLKDSVTVAVNDRLLVDGVDYRVYEIRPLRTQSTTVVILIFVARVTDTTNW